jgi:hypothetical protein
MAKAIGLLLLFVTIAVVGTHTARGAQPAAIVTDVRGEAHLADGSAIGLLRELAPGAEVRLKPSSQLVLIHLPRQSTYALSGPGSYVIRAREVFALAEGRVAPAKALPAAFQGVRLQAARIAQASIAMRGTSGEQGIRQLFPVATWLLARPDALRWERPAHDLESDFIVQLTDSENRTVFETTTRVAELPLPGELRLEPGKLYGWQVKAVLADGRTLEAWAEFGVADADLRARVESARPPQGAGDAERIAYALFLEALDLREAARAQWAEAARGRPHEPRLRALAESH